MTDSFGFCRRLLEETRVGLAPGVAFGAGGEGSIRICYAAEQSILEPAMERLDRVPAERLVIERDRGSDFARLELARPAGV